MKCLLHEFHRESVILLKQGKYGQPADNLSRGLFSLICEPFDHRAAVRYALAALQEVVLQVSGDEKRGVSALQELLPSGLADTMVMVIEYVHEHVQRETKPSRAEAEFIFNVTCSICTFVAHMVESHKRGNKPLHTGEESWQQRSWVRHSLTATIEDKIRSLRPRRASTQTELFADIGVADSNELLVDQEACNDEALRKIHAVVSGSVTSLEHISYASMHRESDESRVEGKAVGDEEEDGYRGMGVSESFSPIIASVHSFVSHQGLRQRKSDRDRRRKTLYELRCDAHESELLYSVGCALSAFLMAVFIDGYRHV